MLLAVSEAPALRRQSGAITGKAEFKANFERSFQQFRVEQTVVWDATVVAGDWAFDRGHAHTILLPVAGGDSVEVDPRSP